MCTDFIELEIQLYILVSCFITNLFIKHLHEYIEQVMSVVINRLELVSNITLEQIFAQVRDSVDATIETLKNSRLLEKDTYINLVLRGAF